jgi:hypothetical protein
MLLAYMFVQTLYGAPFYDAYLLTTLGTVASVMYTKVHDILPLAAKQAQAGVRRNDGQFTTYLEDVVGRRNNQLS